MAKGKGTSGSYAHIGERMGAGECAGAGELNTTNHHGPGKAAMRTKGGNAENPMRPTAATPKIPKGRQGEES